MVVHHRRGVGGRLDPRLRDEIFRFLYLRHHRIDDRDAALAERGRVDAVENETVSALVVDVDARVAAGDLQPAVAGTENLTGNRDLAPLWGNIRDDDRLSLRVEVSLDGNTIDAEGDAGQRLAAGVQQAAAGGRAQKGIAYMERHGVHAALHETVDVQIAGRDRDASLGDDLRRISIDRSLEIRGLNRARSDERLVGL